MNTNLGIIIGTIALILGVAAFALAAFLKFSRQKGPTHLLRYFLYCGIPILFLVSIAEFLEFYRTSNWSHCIFGIGLLFVALNALLVSRNAISPASNEGAKES